MIDKLRKRFIAVAMLAVFVVLLCITAFINLWNLSNIYADADSTIASILLNDGYFPKPTRDRDKPLRHSVNPSQSPEAPFSTRYFAVTYNSNGDELATNTSSIAAVDTEQALALAEQVLQSGRQQGTTGSYRYGVSQQQDKTLVVFLDCSRDLHYATTLLMSSIAVALIGFVAVSLLIIIFSRAAVRPMAVSYQRQRQFITDAGHELKTPLAIISAANEVLELEHEESEWTRSIANQVQRLSQLTAQLVSLTRMEEDSTPVMSQVALSEAVEQAAEALQPLAAAQGKQIECHTTQGVTVTGSEQSLGQLVTLLVDNAIKYSPPASTIGLSLTRQGRHAILRVYNPCAAIAKGDHPELFERFYRGDASRSSKTGGYGLGLSIARAICDTHRAAITAWSEDGSSLTVTVTI